MDNQETLATLETVNSTNSSKCTLENTKRSINNGQTRLTGNFGHTTEGKCSKQTLDKTQREMKNRQSRDTGNIGHTRYGTKTNKAKLSKI